MKADLRHQVARKRVRFDLPGTADVVVRRGIPYGANQSGVQTLDLYEPLDRTDEEPAPAVLFVSGLSDIGARQVLGCRINEMESFNSWSRLVAASGIAGITHTTGADPASDARAALAHLLENGAGLGLDSTRIGLWACSAHVPNALGLLIDQGASLRCAALLYGFMLDLDEATGVAEAQQTWRFVNPAAGSSVSDLPAGVPLLIARAGQDAIPGVNDSIDRFLAHAAGHGLPVTVENYVTGAHAFDMDDDSETANGIVRRILRFLQTQLKNQS
jgi:dienelactone hydrolase